MRLNSLRPKHLLLILFLALLIGYSLYQARFLILGPEIQITSHIDGSTATSSNITLRGEAHNAAWLTLNGDQIFTDAEGGWEETLLVSKGVSIMTITAKDRFGREKSVSIRIIFNG